jgi:hypothetical protein
MPICRRLFAVKARASVLRSQQKSNFTAFWMLLARDWYSFAEILPRTIMAEEANVVAIYPDHDTAELAVAKLRDASFDVTKLSIIAKKHTEESVVEYETTWERMKYWGLRGAFRGGIWGLLLGAGFFLIPGVSPALTAGPLLGALVTGLGSAAMVGGLSALGAVLIHLGNPKEDAIKYANAITAHKFLVIAQGTPEEVARARLMVGDAFVP